MIIFRNGLKIYIFYNEEIVLRFFIVDQSLRDRIIFR